MADTDAAVPAVADHWALALGKLVIPALIGAGVAFVGTYMTFTNQSRELDLKMVDVSLSILSGDRGGIEADVADEKSFAEYRLARLFALRALDKYSGVDIPPDEMQEWAGSGKISFGRVPVTGGWTGITDVCPPGTRFDPTS